MHYKINEKYYYYLVYKKAVKQFNPRPWHNNTSFEINHES